MLPLHISSKCNVKPASRILFQWISVSARSCSSSSSSSSSSDSSDSSDSDSDTEKAKPETTHVKSTSPASAAPDSKYDLDSFLNNMIKARKSQKTIQVAMQPKKPKDQSGKYVPFEKKIINAAEDVAKTLGGDERKTMSDLLEKVVASRVEALKREQASVKSLHQKTAWSKQVSEQNVQKSYQDKHLEKKSIIRTLLDEYNKRPEEVNVPPKQVQPKVFEDSISRQLLKTVKTSRRQSQDGEMRPDVRHEDIDLWNGKPSQIFENMSAPSPNIPELKTWALLDRKELKAMATHSPANIFQELILWTEQGKLWKFPVDNEQGMEEEHSVHFSEHVFMERHLKGWCPKSGPIRHFMELVCVGLSKNPYMTVEEKTRHIMWYKEYFESKQDILQEVGAILEPFPDKVKEITE
ncbi:PREDICTED: 28S ribosomal protein S31, mitochondrial [Vollenhovia emeryi]|uniref:28S ribosomal protein S31, mitochondrial n=1 Tax=Vollenhovia emeryi TaxID=411798 RepID=UPI0005F4FCA9|nr:PREDICTED: 28S ribosomal protein S31, mitochondrial [Vollenhovia emeryi]XP_011874572.1 PREDICTED: 28S ribosomal protein S31, mitochondrial [Vollenhovia emeryi]